ncbi:peptidoglycan bridge formation glycyltransferase FemA/FemB family protein [Patescibacteria group bacterium]|nr:peptidoglycan bridge formation glycyltransferase FemA/FemB family protein [Patescibacteria group bacterium]
MVPQSGESAGGRQGSQRTYVLSRLMKDWKDYKYRSLWQHPFWDTFMQSVGRRTWRFGNDGARAIVVKHSMPLNLCWLEVPRGPLFEDQESLQKILEDIRHAAEAEKAVFIRMSSYQSLPLNIPDTGFDRHPQTSLVIDLSVSEEEILAQMKQKGRYNIKVAEKHDVKVEVSSDIETFYHLLKKTGERDDFGIHEKEYYQNLLVAMGQNAQLLVARYEDRVVAGGIFVYLDEWGIYYYGASDSHYRNVMAPYLLQWEAIKEAKKRGCKYYDFLGIAPEGAVKHPWLGVTGFKKKFGGEVVAYPKAKDLVLRPFWYFLYKFAKKK